MRVIFAGTPDFSRVALERLHDAGHEIVLVLTQPDRPAGRGMKLQASPVKQFAIAQAIPVAQPRSLRLEGKYPQDAAAARAGIEAVAADIMVVAAYGLILPAWALQGPRLGCLNVHASLLPRWRGAAPIQRAIEAGDDQTGVTIMQMDEGLDTGDMLLAAGVPIAGEETAGSLHGKLAELGGQLIVQALELAGRGELRPVRQPAQGVTYAHKIDKAEAAVDWSLPAVAIARRIRAFNPFPGASATLGGEVLKLWGARIASAPSDRPAPPGVIVAVAPEGISVACGSGNLLLTRLQRPGGRPLAAADFLRGFALKPAMAFEPGAS